MERTAESLARGRLFGLGRHLRDSAGKVRRFYRRTRAEFRYRWPVYDVWRRVRNTEPRRLYRLEAARMAPREIEETVIRQLRETGISMVQLDDLLPGRKFSEIQRWAAAQLQVPAARERIAAVEGGARPKVKGDKYYIVRPLGDTPVFAVDDAVIGATLSDPILRVVCGYLGMFARLVALDLWYNVPMEGPDVFSQRWHRDPEDRALIKTFLYLRDVGESNGAFCYVPGTHNAGPLRQRIGRYNYPDDGVIEERFPSSARLVCTGRAGTLVFCDTTGFHRGGHATAGARFVFNAVYTTNGSEPLTRAVSQFSLKGSRSDLQSPAARYAVGLVRDA